MCLQRHAYAYSVCRGHSASAGQRLQLGPRLLPIRELAQGFWSGASGPVAWLCAWRMSGGELAAVSPLPRCCVMPHGLAKSGMRSCDDVRGTACCWGAWAAL